MIRDVTARRRGWAFFTRLNAPGGGWTPASDAPTTAEGAPPLDTPRDIVPPAEQATLPPVA